MLFQSFTGSPIAQILSNKDRFDIAQDKLMHCYLNSSSLISSKTGDTSFCPIVGLLIKSSFSGPTKVKVKSAPSFSEDLKTVLDAINKSDQAKVQVLEDKPDEIAGNRPKESKLCQEAIQSYQEKMIKFSECYESASGLCNVLLKTTLPKTMWGAKDIKANLSKMKLASSENKETFEIAAEQSDFRLGHVTSYLMNKMSNSRTIESSVNNIISNFITMKKMMTSFVHSFHNLYASDQIFKKHTGYPATWFFDPSVFYNFTSRYEDVCENLVEATRAESSVIRPLYAWKTGDN
jgi:hypothetical protein